MVESPPITITGPQKGGTTGKTTNLYLVESAKDNTSTNTNKKNIPLEEDDQSILSVLTGKREVRYVGKTNGYRLDVSPVPGSDIREKVVNYLFELESLVQPQMGDGYELVDTVRDKTYDPSDVGVLFSLSQWTVETGSGLVVDYRVNGKQASGMQNREDRTQYISDQQSRRGSVSQTEISFDGGNASLGDIGKMSYERSLDLKIQELIQRFDIDNLGVITSGVSGTITLSGTITREDVSGIDGASDIGEATEVINRGIHDQQVDLSESITDRTFTGAITSSDTNFESGVPDKFDYNISMDIGVDVLS